MIRIGILEPTDFSPRALEMLGEIGKVSCFDGGGRAKFLMDKEVVFLRLSHRVDTAFLREAPKLKVIVSPTTGITHLDLDAIKGHGVVALTLAGQTEFLRGITASSEHCLGLILGVLRNYPRAMLRPGNVHWDRDSVRGHDINGLSIGLIGLGRIGQWLARILSAMGANISYFDTSPRNNEAPQGAVCSEGLLQLIERSSLVVLTASYKPGTPPVLSADLIDALKGKYFVNISRGELVDEKHLLRRLGEGWFAGIALDVLASEPRALEELAAIAGLAGTQNFMLTPHVGGATYESSFRTEEFMAGRLIEYLLKDGIKE